MALLNAVPARTRFFGVVVGMWLGVLIGGLGVHRAWAEGDVLYGALIMATKEEHPAEPPAELRNQVASLKTVFGYNQFRLLGKERKAVPSGTEDWLVPSRKFFLRVDTKKPVPNGYLLGLQLLKDEQPIVSADVKLSRERPLYIRGPLVGEGQLIILLMVL